MATSGYFHADNQQENPEILCSDDGLTWAAPPGVTNPLEPAPGGSGFNNDQCLFVDDSNVMWIVWVLISADGNTATIYARTSTDGSTWTAKQVLYQVARGTHQPAGTTIFRQPDGTWRLLWADAQHLSSTSYLTQTASTPAGPWSAPVAVTVNNLPSGWAVWEANIVPYPHGYIGTTTIRNIASGATQLTLFTSPDGTTWTLSLNPVMFPGPSGAWDGGQIYRASIANPSNNYKTWEMWYSANDGASNWFSGHTSLVVA